MKWRDKPVTWRDWFIVQGMTIVIGLVIFGLLVWYLAR